MSISYVRPVRLSVTDSLPPSGATPSAPAFASVWVLMVLPLRSRSVQGMVETRPSQPSLLLGRANRLDPVAAADFPDRRREVIADGAGREVQGAGDVGHRRVLARGGQHVVLARG